MYLLAFIHSVSPIFKKVDCKSNSGQAVTESLIEAFDGELALRPNAHGDTH